jgi:hypothetical protein
MTEYTSNDVRLAQTAIDALGRTTPLEQDVHDGLTVINGWIADGWTIATIVTVTEKSSAAVGRLKTIARVGRMVASTDGTGILEVNRLLNAATSPVKTIVAPWEKDGRTFASWSAVETALKALASEAVEDDTEDGEEGEAEASEKSQGERFSDLVAAIQKHGRDYGIDAIDVALDLVNALEAAADTDAAADEAELAS